MRAAVSDTLAKEKRPRPHKEGKATLPRAAPRPSAEAARLAAALVAIRPAAAALAGWAASTARNQDAVAAMGEEALTDTMAALLLGAQQVGEAGFSDRSMLMRMMGQPWATGSAQQQGGKAAAADMGARLAAALNRAERQLARLPDPGPVIEATRLTVPMRSHPRRRWS